MGVVNGEYVGNTQQLRHVRAFFSGDDGLARKPLTSHTPSRYIQKRRPSSLLF
jgi:hypothetical protein